MAIYRLPDDEIIFPHPELADRRGLLAVGGGLSPDRLLLAYENGIFPWYNPGEEILWWSPDPRYVLFPDDLKVSKSMRPYFNQKKFEVTFDKNFEEVIKECGEVERKRQAGTWITDEMTDAYVKMHQLGFAHSVEVWKGNELVGGLYGISLGKMFFGESMFSKVSNASKFGFITLVNILKLLNFKLIDVQTRTRHLLSLGAKPIPRSEFLQLLAENKHEKTLRGTWEINI